MQFVVCQHLFIFSCAQAVSTSSKPLLLNCKRLFDSFILAQCVFFSFQLHLVCLWAEPPAVQSSPPDSSKTNDFQALSLVKLCCVHLLSEKLESHYLKNKTPL